MRALQCLTDVLNAIKEQKLSLQLSPNDRSSSSSQTSIPSELNPPLFSLISTYATEIASRHKDERIQLTRGQATIPLKGIDVPFHSSHLSPGVSAFRRCLLQQIDNQTLDVGKLTGKYIPNLTAQPFEVTKEYFELVLEKTGSTAIREVLKNVSILRAIVIMIYSPRNSELN